MAADDKTTDTAARDSMQPPPQQSGAYTESMIKVREGIQHVRTRPGATDIYTSCADAPGGPGPFYERMGFTYTGALDEGERVMRRPLDR